MYNYVRRTRFPGRGRIEILLEKSYTYPIPTVPMYNIMECDTPNMSAPLIFHLYYNEFITILIFGLKDHILNF